MRPGVLYLGECGPAARNNYVELDRVFCTHCRKSYRFFTPKDWKEEEGVTDLGWDVQTKSLRERAQRAIDLDCPTIKTEGQPKRAAHPSRIRLLESGGWAE